MTLSLLDPRVIIAGIRQFGLASDGSDLRDLEAAFVRAAQPASPLRGREAEMQSALLAAEVAHQALNNRAAFAGYQALDDKATKLRRAALGILPEDRFLGRCQHCLDNACFHAETQLCERDLDCLIRREREARAASTPEQP